MLTSSISTFVVWAIIAAVAIMALFVLYIIIGVAIERYHFRKNMVADQECSLLVRENGNRWFECGTVRCVNHITGKVDVITEAGNHITVNITDTYPPFQYEMEETLAAND